MSISEDDQFKQFENCITIEGSLIISSITYGNLSFPNLLVIKGYLVIHKVDNLTSVKQLLPNLVHIQGASPRAPDKALIIRDNKDLVKLDFKKLLRISSGRVEITENPRLCFSDTIAWSKTQAHIYTDLNLFEQNIQV